jgi:hypothetical protein
MHRPGYLCVLLAAVPLFGGCFAGTPVQALWWSGARIDRLEATRPSPVRVRLGGLLADDTDIFFLRGLCTNHSSDYSELRELDLSYSRITDGGLEDLGKDRNICKSLRVLKLRGCNVTDGAVEKLRQELDPDCRIIR